ncbi:MAG: AbrB/MazE/SpoVT family DNA-binding domain-containing protein [Armatimonadota bacterium]|nr:AbrB/MazE/SpoVT family DNA-binding domain-containing protein [Armatimonadota bacterium]MDR7435394.1 AbrB/MazE/SpoVT family DNA-binding domain-containing protein [Armatimonadota bacterium]
MARIVKREGPLVVALRTEGAIIIPKPLRDSLGLRPGDLLEIEVKEGDLILRPRPVRRLKLSGVPATSLDTLTGLVSLGGDAVKDKKRLYEP